MESYGMATDPGERLLERIRPHLEPGESILVATNCMTFGGGGSSGPLVFLTDRRLLLLRPGIRGLTPVLAALRADLHPYLSWRGLLFTRVSLRASDGKAIHLYFPFGKGRWHKATDIWDSLGGTPDKVRLPRSAVYGLVLAVVSAIGLFAGVNPGARIFWGVVLALGSTAVALAVTRQRAMRRESP